MCFRCEQAPAVDLFGLLLLLSAPLSWPRFQCHSWEELEKLAIKGQQWAIQLLRQHHKLGVVAGAAMADCQLKNLLPDYRVFAQLQALQGLVPEHDRLLWLHQACAHVLQQDMAKFRTPEGWNSPIRIAAQLRSHIKA